MPAALPTISAMHTLQWVVREARRWQSSWESHGYSNHCAEYVRVRHRPCSRSPRLRRRKENQKASTVKLKSDEGLLALVVHTKKRIAAIHFAEDGEGADGFTYAQLQPGWNFQLFKLEADRYCITTIEWLYGAYHAAEAEMCIDIEPGKLAYPGHISFEVGGGRGVTVYFEPTVTRDYHDLKRRMQADYPEIAEKFMATR